MELQIAPTSRAAETIGESSPPEELIAWSLEKFADRRMVLSTAFGMEGCVLIDMYARDGRPLEVVYLDTMFFFPQTYALRDRLIARYPHLEFVNRGTSLTPEDQRRIHGDELWKRDPDACCRLRKIEPMHEVMSEVDVWITGVRKSQSETRAGTRVLEWDWRYQLLKLCPLAHWDRRQVWDYVRANDVPYNPLHEQGYPTIGCTHCTRPVPGSQIGEYSRDGRWGDTRKKECGLHGEGI
ncbi:MAG: phosphoadenylyl-sulfate reductase [Planctomycetota bacterium]|nr:phosphoadenylyl-sulfate reductase [Planctomycetota bacterium]